MSKHRDKRDKEKKMNYGEKYKIYYGITHCHTALSTGKGTPAEAFNYAKSKKLDFLMITDHSTLLKAYANHNKHKKMKWQILKEEVKNFNKKHKSFTGMAAFECKLNSIGDINIYNSQNLIERNIKRLSYLEEWMEGEEDCIASINHPHSPINKLYDWQHLNKYIRLLEVANGSPPYHYKRFYKQYFDFLDKGWKLGAVIGQDNHIKNWGDQENLTAVLCEKPDGKSLIEALKSLRTYACESKSLQIVYRINDKIMGNTVFCGEGSPLRFNIKIQDKKIPIEKIQLITNGGFVLKDFKCASQKKINLYFEIKACNKNTWYLIKVFQKEKRFSLTSPIFISMTDII